MDHDIYLPFHMVKQGLRAIYVPAARGVEKMVPSIDGEIARKRRFMSHVWITVLRGGMLSPRGYGLRYGLMILSHRVLRYGAPMRPRRRARHKCVPARSGDGVYIVHLLLCSSRCWRRCSSPCSRGWRAIACSRLPATTSR